jgi:hypothetical protein
MGLNPGVLLIMIKVGEHQPPNSRLTDHDRAQYK